MRRIAILFLTLTLSIACIAQSMRSIKGITVDEGGVAVPNVMLKVEGVSTEFHSDRTGQFEISVPVDSKTMTAFANGYAATGVNIAGQFVIVRLNPEGRASESNYAIAATAGVYQTPVSDVPRDTEAPQSGKKSKQYNKGFYNAIDISYSYSFSQGRAIYTNIGERAYTTLHPMQISYSIGYKLSQQYIVYAGIGFMYNIAGVEKYDTIDKDIYGDFKPRAWDLPVYLGATFSFGDGPVRPLVLLRGGLYVMALVPDFELGVGMSVDCGGRNAFSLALTARNVEWPHLSVTQFKGYPVTIAPSVKLGFSF